jgi:hypothetical protein
LHDEGLFKLNIEVPTYWESYEEKSRRLIERVVADVIWRGFEKEEFSNALFRHPSHYMQGFSFRRLDNAFLRAAENLNRKYLRFMKYYRIAKQWKNPYLMKKQVETFKNKLGDVATLLGIGQDVTDTSFALLSQLERRLELEIIDCLVNDIVLWELGDEL